jgi:hypothetical protein
VIISILLSPFILICYSVLYAHKLQAWWVDINKPEQFGFASKYMHVPIFQHYADRHIENQITPFNFTTPDHETIYAWHVMPLGLYAKHEAEILHQPSGCAEDVTKTKAFKLLRDDPDSRLIINCKRFLQYSRKRTEVANSIPVHGVRERPNPR